MSDDFGTEDEPSLCLVYFDSSVACCHPDFIKAGSFSPKMPARLPLEIRFQWFDGYKRWGLSDGFKRAVRGFRFGP